MGCGGGTNMGPTLNANATQQGAENIAVGRVQNAFSGFTPAFYGGISQAYQNQALPQLQQQYSQNSNQLGFHLANAGLGQSSQAQQGYQGLNDAFNAGKTAIAEQGQNVAQQQQQQVANQEASLIGEAQTASNPQQIATSAMNTALGYQAPSTFAPIGNMFSNFANQYLGSQNQASGNQLQQLLSALLIPTT